MDVLNHRLQTTNAYEYFYRHKNYATIAGLAYGEFTKLHRDFSKLEKTLSTEVDDSGGDDGFEDTQEQIKEVKSAFSKPPIILANEENEGIHAEVQLLSFILQKHEENKEESSEETKQKEQYIGISKLCCLHCRCMLEAANQVFKENDVPIKIGFRGHHDLDFTTWKPPQLFAEGFNSSKGNDEDDSIAFQIGRTKEIMV